MAFKVVSYESPVEFVVTVYEMGGDGLYTAQRERQRFPIQQRQRRDRYVEDKLTQYGALSPTALRTFDFSDEWDETDPRERDRRGL
jgi:hypothetical protein